MQRAEDNLASGVISIGAAEDLVDLEVEAAVAVVASEDLAAEVLVVVVLVGVGD